MLHFFKRHHHRIQWVFHVVGFRKVERDNERRVGGFHLGNAGVFIAFGLDNVLYAKLIANLVGAQRVEAAVGLKDGGQARLLAESLQRQVAFGFAAAFPVPVRIQVRLPHQRNRAHQRNRINLFGRAFVEREVRGGVGFQQHFVFAARTQMHHRTRAPRNAVGVVGQHRAEAQLAQFLGFFGIRSKDFRTRIFGFNGFVPVIRAFLVGFVLRRTAKKRHETERLLFHFGHSVVGVYVHQAGIYVPAFQIGDGGSGGDGGFRTGRLNHAAPDDERGIGDNCLVVNVQGGVGEGVQPGAFVIHAVAREGGGLCPSLQAGQQGEHQQR